MENNDKKWDEFAKGVQNPTPEEIKERMFLPPPEMKLFGVDTKQGNGGVYLEILNRIKSEDTRREWMNEPFNAYGKTMATNAYILVAAPIIDGFIERPEKVQSVYPFEKNMNKVITLKEIKDKIALFTTIDCYDESEQECKACYGSGIVEFEFDYGNTIYDIEGECPICGGEGTSLQTSKIPNGKKEHDYNKLFQIGNSAFNVERIEELIFISEKLNSDLIITYQQHEYKPTVFSISDVEVLLMPTIKTDSDVVAQYIA